MKAYTSADPITPIIDLIKTEEGGSLMILAIIVIILWMRFR
jgi:hypothetical protein